MTAALINTSDARSLTDKIKVAVEGTWHLITEAYTSRAWSALGYSSWDDYCTREFGTSRLRLPREDRAETVQSLRESGLSLRAIASATGASKQTVIDDLRVVQTGPPDVYEVAAERIAGNQVDHETGEVLDDETIDRAGDILRDAKLAGIEAITTAERHPTVTGIDGKTYTKCAPATPRRKPLVDEFRGAFLDLETRVKRITKLAADDRFNDNADQISRSYRSDLIRARDALQCVLDQLP